MVQRRTGHIMKNFIPLLIFVAVIWIVELVNFFLGHELLAWGILPRQMSGLIGIPLAPFLHGGLWHAASNTPPLLILGSLMLISDRTRFWTISAGIILLGGAFSLVVRPQCAARWCQRTGIWLFRGIAGPRIFRAELACHRISLRYDDALWRDAVGHSAATQFHLIRRPFFWTGGRCGGGTATLSSSAALGKLLAR